MRFQAQSPLNQYPIKYFYQNFPLNLKLIKFYIHLCLFCKTLSKIKVLKSLTFKIFDVIWGARVNGGLRSWIENKNQFGKLALAAKTCLFKLNCLRGLQLQLMGVFDSGVLVDGRSTTAGIYEALPICLGKRPRAPSYPIWISKLTCYLFGKFIGSPVKLRVVVKLRLWFTAIWASLGDARFFVLFFNVLSLAVNWLLAGWTALIFQAFGLVKYFLSWFFWGYSMLGSKLEIWYEAPY